jgi:hypothetical protein
MGFISSSITVIIGYFAIEFIKKHKKNIKDIPILSEFIEIDKEDNDKISNDAYLIVLAFALKDFIF